MRKCRRLLLAWIVVCCVAPSARADDWPQWLGPQRDGVWRETGLLDRFPAAGPKVLWRAPVGGGYSGPAVSQGRVFVADFTPSRSTSRPSNAFQRVTQPGTERVLCFDQGSGRQVWTYSTDVAYGISYSMGPRATPAVDGDFVYAVGGEGDLVCLRAATGEKVWHGRVRDEKAQTPIWGFSAHPLIDGDRLICMTLGSTPESGHGTVTAFDKHTGKTVWSALVAKEPGYAPPLIVRAGGVRQLIVWDPAAVNALDPETGKVYWSQPFGPVNLGLSVMTPRFAHDAELGDVLFVSTQYEGAMLLKLDEKEPKASVAWKRVGKNDRHTDALHVLLSTVSIHDGHLFGVDTYGQLRCLDLKTGNRLWETFAATTYEAGEQKWASAFLIRLGDTGSRHLIANEHGDLILANLDAGGYHEMSRAHLLEPTNGDPGRKVVWSHPACAGRCFFWRNDKELVCVSMAAEAGT